MKATVPTEKGKTMTDYQRLVDFFMDEIPEGSPFAGKIKYLVEKLLAKGVTFQKWIPVTERLPERYDFVLIATIDKTVGEAVLNGDRHFYGVNTDEYAEQLCVTHWMPLPEPPKEE